MKTAKELKTGDNVYCLSGEGEPFIKEVKDIRVSNHYNNMLEVVFDGYLINVGKDESKTGNRFNAYFIDKDEYLKCITEHKDHLLELKGKIDEYISKTDNYIKNINSL